MGAYTDDVLFIHIPKCGGMVCKEYMLKHLDGVKWPRPSVWFRDREGREGLPTAADQWLADQSVEESKLPMGHVPLRDIPLYTGRSIDSWERIIVVIRNPYEQQVSQWSFWRERYARGDSHPNDIHAAKFPRLGGWLETPEADFHLWYEQRFKPDSPLVKKPPSAANNYANWGGFYPYWFTVDGKAPDNLLILRQEALSHQFPLALAPWIDGVPPPMPERVNVGGHGDWRHYYLSQRDLDIVNMKFRWTFDGAQAYPKMYMEANRAR